MKLQDVEHKLLELKLKRKGFRSSVPKLVEAIVEYTLVESPRVWYLLEIPDAESRCSSSGGWRKIVGIMIRRGHNISSITEKDNLINILGEAFVFSGSTNFRQVVTALMFKVSKEHGIIHHWQRVLYVSAKYVLDKDLSDPNESGPKWEEPLELNDDFIQLRCPFPALQSTLSSSSTTTFAHENHDDNDNNNTLTIFDESLNNLMVINNVVEYHHDVSSSSGNEVYPIQNSFIISADGTNGNHETCHEMDCATQEIEEENIDLLNDHPHEYIIDNDCFRTIEDDGTSNEIITQIITDVQTF